MSPEVNLPDQQVLDDLVIFAQGGIDRLIDTGFENIPDRLRAVYAYSWSVVTSHLESTTAWDSLDEPAERLDETLRSLCSVFGNDEDKERAIDCAMICSNAKGMNDNLVTGVLFDPALGDIEYGDEKLQARLGELIDAQVVDPLKARELTAWMMVFLPLYWCSKLLWRDVQPTIDPQEVISLVRKKIADGNT